MMNSVTEKLVAIATFTDLSDEDRYAIADICHAIEIDKDTVIANQGLDADRLFVILTGKVGIWIDYGMDSADLLTVTEAPNLVGELSVVDELPRSATMVTQTTVTGYTISADDFRKLLKDRGTIALSLMKGISRIVRSSNDSFIHELRMRNNELIIANNDLKQAQRQLLRQDRLSSLGKFSSMIMHDLRNPLSVINAYADMLSLKLEGDDENTLELKKYTNQIHRETIRLTGLTNELLDYSKGEVRLVYAPSKTADLFKSLDDSVGSSAKSKEINLIWNNEFEEVILLDIERILRVLINLFDNSLKACRKHNSITVSSKKKGNYLCITVADNGIGMDYETRTHVFDPFYTNSENGGTGLGMHIVKTVVEAHNGTVEIQSAIKKGTEVSIYLPLRFY